MVSRSRPILLSLGQLLRFQVYGANTDVGKTIVSAGLCRAAVQEGVGPKKVKYIKPIQTGGDDAGFVKHHAGKGASEVRRRSPLESSCDVGSSLLSVVCP